MSRPKKTTSRSAAAHTLKLSAPPPQKDLSSQDQSEIISEEEYVAPKPKAKKTSPYMSVYEYCSLISARAVQIGVSSENEPRVPLLTPEDYDPLVIATREVHANLATLIIRRRLPDGSTEDWMPKDMIFPRI